MADRENSSNNNVTARLPQIEIPQFSGDYQAWPIFYESLNSLVHENTSDNKQR